MIGFKNTYLSTEEILNKISYISGENILGVILTILCIVGVSLFILYFFPIASIYKEHISKQRQKFKRKNMIRQIAMQKEIEEEIEKEL